MIKPNGSCKSIIDLWLATPEILKYESDVSICIAPLTDHRLIYLALNPESRTKYKKDYWKFNADLLKDDEYVKTIKDRKLRMIAVSVVVVREYFKFKVREFSIKFSKLK